MSLMPSQRILVVEDHADTASFIAGAIRDEGYDSHVSLTLADARVQLAEQRFSLVLADLGLPDGDGYGLARRLINPFGVPCIAVTGHTQDCEVERCIASGFAGHISKPISLLSLISAVKGVLSIQS